MATSAERILVEPGSGRLVSFFGMQMTFKVRAAQTSGAFSIIEGLYPPGNFTPPHRHDRTDEVTYVLEGEFGFMVAEEEFQAGPGSFVVRPKGVPHALRNITDRPVRFIDVYTPGGFEAWYEELARLLSAPEPPPLDQLFQAGRRYDSTFLPDLAPPLIEKYKLRMPG